MKAKADEIFNIEADGWMTGGATRGRGRKIITKIEREVNDKGEREERDYNFTPGWIDWQWQTESEREEGQGGAGDGDGGTSDVKQTEKA